MATALMKRFGHWVGTWRGGCELDDGGAGVLEVSLLPHFDGHVLEVSARIWEKDGGAMRSHGVGFWSVNRAGRLENVMWADRLGFCHLEETPDDPDVIAMEGTLAGNLSFSVSFRAEDDSLLMSSGVGEGYASGGKPRTYSRMFRLGMAPKDDSRE